MLLETVIMARAGVWQGDLDERDREGVPAVWGGGQFAGGLTACLPDCLPAAQGMADKRRSRCANIARRSTKNNNINKTTINKPQTEVKMTALGMLFSLVA